MKLQESVDNIVVKEGNYEKTYEGDFVCCNCGF